MYVVLCITCDVFVDTSTVWLITLLLPPILRFDLTDGFNGIPEDVTPEDGNENTTLSYKWFTEAADAAGFSRLLGGIHFMQGKQLCAYDMYLIYSTTILIYYLLFPSFHSSQVT